jgi:hypothetical protein
MHAIDGAGCSSKCHDLHYDSSMDYFIREYFEWSKGLILPYNATINLEKGVFVVRLG